MEPSRQDNLHNDDDNPWQNLSQASQSMSSREYFEKKNRNLQRLMHNQFTNEDSDPQITIRPSASRSVSTIKVDKKEPSKYESAITQRFNQTINSDGFRPNSILRLADTISQNILLHPFVALRRTCQVNRKCSPYICIQPFSLIPFMFHQQRKQGLGALYRGLSSELLVKGITLGTETAIAGYTDWPRDIRPKHYLEDSLKVTVLRALSVAISTPFLCSSVIETVQSFIVVKDRPSFIDCLKDGLGRLLHLKWTPSVRMLPIWLLIGPTVIYHVAHSSIWYLSKGLLSTLSRSFCPSVHQRSPTNSRMTRYTRGHNLMNTENDTTWQPDELTIVGDANDSLTEIDSLEMESHKISSSILASLLTDIALLPFETVLHSLYIQGTRTIIDNCDETTVVLPVLTNYDGLSDCYQSILKFEGQLGLYKGFGAIILQYSVHFLMFRLLYHVLREFQASNRSYPNASKYPLISDQRQSHQSTTGKPRRDFMRLLDTNARHSTPINPTDYDHFGKQDGETPRRSDRL